MPNTLSPEAAVEIIDRLLAAAMLSQKTFSSIANAALDDDVDEVKLRCVAPLLALPETILDATRILEANDVEFPPNSFVKLLLVAEGIIPSDDDLEVAAASLDEVGC